MSKILYIDTRVGDKIYEHYNTIYHGLTNNKNYKVAKTNVINTNVINTFNNYDLIIIGYGYMSQGSKKVYSHRFKTKTPIIGFLYKISQCTDAKIAFLKENNMIIIGSSSRLPELEKLYNINIHPVLYPFNPSIFKDYCLEKIYDIGMTGALHDTKHYPKSSFRPEEHDIRSRLCKLIKKSKLKYYIKMSDQNATAGRIMNYTEYAKTINRTKIWVATNADTGDITARASEIAPCRTLLFYNEQQHNTFSSILKDGVTCVYFKNNLSDFMTKVLYYLQNTTEYDKIVNNAYHEFHEKHTTIKKIDELAQIAKNYVASL